jgi:hypothetical protein
MIPKVCKVLGLSATISVSENQDEFNLLAGSPDACHNEALNNVLYRGVYPELRAKLSEKLEAETEVPRGSKTNEAGKSTYIETEQTYYNRLIANGHVTEERAQELMDEVSLEVVFDPSPSRRRSGAPKEIVAAAEGILDAIKAGQSTEERVGSKLAAAVGAADFVERFGKFSLESVTAALVAHKEITDRERKNAFL